MNPPNDLFTREFDPIGSLTATVVNALVIFLIGQFVYYFNAKKSRADRIRGQFIPHWMAGCSVVGGMYAVVIHIGHIGPEYSVGISLYGMLIGLAIGLVHGSWRVHHAPDEVKAVPEKQALTIAPGEPAVRSDNPYSPPVRV